MKISMVCSTLSYNPMIRVYPFAKFLSKKFDVELVGPYDENGLYQPLRDEGSNVNGTREAKVFPFYLSTTEKIYNNINGDFMHVFKAKLNSFGVALLKKKKSKMPLILDIDDWDSQYVFDNFFKLDPIGFTKFILADFYMPEGYFLKKIFEKLAKHSDGIITSSYGLAKMFNGTCIPSGADTDYFNPNNFNGKKIRERYGIDKDDLVISFIGNPKYHKGVIELIDAVSKARLENEKIKLLIVGADKRGDFHKSFIGKLENKEGVILEGYRPHKEMPEFIAASDIYALPQRSTPSGNVQMPYKTFEGMAMGRAIITTKTTDMERTFKGCGTVVSPDNVNELKNAILNYSENRKLMKEHGRKAREKCIKEYSWKVMEKKTLEVYEKAGINNI